MIRYLFIWCVNSINLHNCIQPPFYNCKSDWATDRFTKLLNDMAMHDKYYYYEDVNTKFIRSLLEMYDEKIIAIREINNLDDITL